MKSIKVAIARQLIASLKYDLVRHSHEKPKRYSIDDFDNNERKVLKPTCLHTRKLVPSEKNQRKQS